MGGSQPIEPVISRLLFGECFAILLCPVAVCRYGFHRWSTFRAACTGALHFSFGHAGAGFGFQASANINHLALTLGLSWHIARRLIRGLFRGAARGDDGQQKQQDRKPDGEAGLLAHGFSLRKERFSSSMTLKRGKDNIHLLELGYDHQR